MCKCCVYIVKYINMFINSQCVKIALLITAGFAILNFVIPVLPNRKRRKKNRYILIEDISEWNKFESEIVRNFEMCEVIGIDCEWVTINGKRNPVSLLQLATSNGFCVLIRLCRIPVWLMPAKLVELLSDKDLLKVGVGVYDDANKLFQDYGLEVYSLIDLRYLARDLPEFQDKNLGLKTLAKVLLNLNLSKSRILRCSNWEAFSLSLEQIQYAADDAIVSAKIFAEVTKRKSRWFFKSNSSFLRELHVYMDIPFKQKNKSLTNKHSIAVANTHKTRYGQPRRKPMYDNCQLVAPDGEILCSCDRGKAEWYVDKGLGNVISDEPFTVRLNFEPSGRPTLDNVFYTKEKSNCCVVCGKNENYRRKLVVPSEYRRYFPNLMKKNLSHDVLPLCGECHKKSNILDLELRMKLAELCDAPLGERKNIKYKTNPELIRIKSAATALCRFGEKIPEFRRKELEKVLLDYYQVESITEEILDDASNLERKDLNDSYVIHGHKVYQYFCKNDGLIQFEKMWRQHFLDTMQPKYLPTMWSVDHNHKRLALQVINHEREVDFDVSILGINDDLLKEIQEYIKQ